MDNYLLNYFDPDYNKGYDFSLIKTKNSIDGSNLNKILSYFGNIKNNELFVYNFRNIHNYFIEKKIFNIDNQIEQEKYFGGFITKYFPKINSSNYKEFLNKKITDDGVQDTYDMYDKVIDTKSKLYSIIYDTYKYLDEVHVNINNIVFNQLIISHNFNLPIDIDLLSIFNQIQLSYNIPFLKLKDPNTKESIYKLFKPITKSSDNYPPIIDKSKLIKWIEINQYECNKGVFIPIKGPTKFINYKLKLTNLQIDNEIIQGTIVKINYTGKIIESISILVNDDILNVPIEFIKKQETFKINDTIEFYNYDLIYGDIEITKKGVLNLKINFENDKYIFTKNKSNQIEIQFLYRSIKKLRFYLNLIKIIFYLLIKIL